LKCSFYDRLLSDISETTWSTVVFQNLESLNFQGRLDRTRGGAPKASEKLRKLQIARDDMARQLADNSIPLLTNLSINHVTNSTSWLFPINEPTPNLPVAFVLVQELAHFKNLRKLYCQPPDSQLSWRMILELLYELIYLEYLHLDYIECHQPDEWEIEDIQRLHLAEGCKLNTVRNVDKISRFIPA